MVKSSLEYSLRMLDAARLLSEDLYSLRISLFAVLVQSWFCLGFLFHPPIDDRAMPFSRKKPASSSQWRICYQEDLGRRRGTSSKHGFVLVCRDGSS